MKKDARYVRQRLVGLAEKHFLYLVRTEQGRGSLYLTASPKESEVIEYTPEGLQEREEVRSCPHCRQGDYIPGKGEKIAFIVNRHSIFMVKKHNNANQVEFGDAR